MKRDSPFLSLGRSFGLAAVGALFGAVLAVLLFGHPFCDQGLHTREHRDCSKGPPLGSNEGPEDGRSDLTPVSSTRLQVDEAQDSGPGTLDEDEVLPGGTSGRSQSVVTLPEAGWTLSLLAAPVPLRGRASDLIVSAKGRVAYVYGDGRQSVLIVVDPGGSTLVVGSEGGHSPFFLGEQLWWLRGREVLHEGTPVVVALSGPGSVSDPTVTPSGGFGLVVNDHSIELFDARAQGLASLDLPERLGGMAWWGDALLFTRFGVGDSDIWSHQKGVLSPFASSPLPELRPSADSAVWWFQESEPGRFDLVRDEVVLEEGVLLPTRQGVSLQRGIAAVASELPGTLLWVSEDETVEVVTGLDWLADPIHVGSGVAFAAPGGIAILESVAAE